MNKALHALVYLFLVLAGAGLYFEIQLNAKRTELTDRNRMQEDYYVRIAKTIEKEAPAKGAAMELKKDSDPVEAKIIDIPNTENVLDDYNAHLEQANLETFNWDSMDAKNQLRAVYVMDFEGNPVMDGNQPLKTGKGTEDELLSQLFEAAKNQQARLNTTRAELVTLRGKLESVVDELNKLKPIARQDKVTLLEKNERITKIEAEKTELEGQITKVKSQIDELNTEITSVKDELNTAKGETEEKVEEIAKLNKVIESLKKIVQESLQTQGTKAAQGGAVVASLPSGDKGAVIDADNENMFAIVRFSETALNEMKGNNPNAMLPAIELGVKRTGFKGPAGEFIGRLKIRQEIKGKSLVICDILGNWEQDKIKVNDTVFAD